MYLVWKMLLDNAGHRLKWVECDPTNSPFRAALLGWHLATCQSTNAWFGFCCTVRTTSSTGAGSHAGAESKKGQKKKAERPKLQGALGKEPIGLPRLSFISISFSLFLSTTDCWGESKSHNFSRNLESEACRCRCVCVARWVTMEGAIVVFGKFPSLHCKVCRKEEDCPSMKLLLTVES